LYLTQALKRAVQINRNELATQDQDRTRTWSESLIRISKLAGAMQKLGFKDNDRSAILSLNSDRYFEALYAAVWAGGIFVPINTRLAAPEIEFWLNDSESSLLFVDSAFAEIVNKSKSEGKIPSVKEIIYMSDVDCPSNMKNYERILDEADAIDDALRSKDDIAGLFYTGGTTGRSKGVMLSHTNLVYNSFNTITALNIPNNARWIHAAPMFHIADVTGAIAITHIAGQHYFMPSFTPDGVLESIQKHKISDTLLVPTMINMLVHHPDIKNYNLSSLRQITYGASPMPESVIVKAMEVIPNCKFTHAYGMTECSPLITAAGPECHVFEGPKAYLFKSTGLAVPGVEVKIIDENDQELPRGKVGEVAARGPNVMLGYWRQKELSDKALLNGWMHTGDGGYMNEDGYVYIVDRVKDMIISGGENIYSAEVENAIYQLDGVVECAVIGIPNKEWGEAVHAIVRKDPKSKIGEDDVIAHSKKLIAGFKCPKSVSFRENPMPLSGAGKILKTTLREPFWEGHEKQVS
tara:strand:+ start:2554 stop:4119 length:1566 start_codon:yes stop_codon:yes gene_type:complete